MLAAEFGTGQVLWSFLWFFLFVIWIWLIIIIFSDIIRSKDMGGVAKALWTLFIIFIPFLGIFLYLILRGGGMAERQMTQAREQQQMMNQYIQETAAGTGQADQLSKLADLHAAGKIDDAEYAAAKAKVLS
jgi:hypothetical protein